MFQLPLIAPAPPRLSEMREALSEIEQRRVFSNGGPVVRQFEADANDRLFGGQGDTLAVSNATTGLMLAIRHAAGKRSNNGHLALVPAFTFAATAQAAMWAGLVPLICDVDPENWSADPVEEERLLKRHGDRIAVVVPYATFGGAIDLDRYQWLSRRHDVGIVVDAAASLGTLDEDGLNFGASAPFAIVYSMHATKTFATAEGGLIHSADRGLIDMLRRMTNFGFGAERRAELPGMNAKLPEISGLLAQAKLEELDGICAHRATLADAYRQGLGGFQAQAVSTVRQAYQFWSFLLPPELADRRGDIIRWLGAKGIGSGHYFSPHLGEQDYFRCNALVEPTPVSDDISRRILSLPITDGMTVGDVETITGQLLQAMDEVAMKGASDMLARTARQSCETLLIGGGPAGTAMLTAASKKDKLARLSSSLVVVEQGRALGEGALGGYAIRSDSTAEPVLSAVKDNGHAEIAALVDHPAGVGMARHVGALGAPLVEAGPLLTATGHRLGSLVTRHGGTVLTGHAALSAHRMPNNMWRTLVGDRQGGMREILSRHIVIATGGYQCPESVARAPVAGSTLADLAGDRLVLSDQFLRVGELDAMRERLLASAAPRIAIVGGSTSALAAAALLLKAAPALPLGAGAITVLHRRALRPFYPSREAALAEGFTDFTDDDICPVSGFVYRLAGFRLEARELVLRMLGIGGREPEPRLSLFRLQEGNGAGAREILDRADLVIGATGYRPHALPLFDMDGAPIRLACDAETPGPMVDRHCRVIDAEGEPVRGAFGIGLAAGFVPWGALGGESSFRGKANGLWLWQNDVGLMIVDQVLAAAQQAVA